MKMKIKLKNTEKPVSDMTYYDMDFIITRDDEEYEVSGILSAYQNEEMAIPEYSFKVEESDTDFTDDELWELQDFAEQHYKD